MSLGTRFLIVALGSLALLTRLGMAGETPANKANVAVEKGVKPATASESDRATDLATRLGGL